MTAAVPLPMPDTTDDFTDPEFDHLEEAKLGLEDVVKSGRLDFTNTIAAAQTHALISIAESLRELVEDDDEDDEDWNLIDSIPGFRVINIGSVRAAHPSSGDSS